VTTARRHVLVSGGSRGLGQATVSALLAQGYAVSTFSRTKTAFVDEMLATHPAAFSFYEADIQDAGSLKELVQRASAQLGPVYGLVNNAGIAADGVLATMSPGDIGRVVSVNLEGTLLLTREVVRRMLTRSEGRILNVSSVIGTRGFSGLATYAATKAALDGMTRALARELGPRQITVNSIAPGYLDTEMTGGLDEEQRRQVVRRTPLGRLGGPQDVTGLTLFLLSDQARFITGQVIVVDGGLSC